MILEGNQEQAISDEKAAQILEEDSVIDEKERPLEESKQVLQGELSYSMDILEESKLEKENSIRGLNDQEFTEVGGTRKNSLKVGDKSTPLNPKEKAKFKNPFANLD